MRELAKKFVPIKVNPEDSTRPENAQARGQYGVSGYPTIVFIHPDGEIITTVVGYVPPQKFRAVMTDALNKYASMD